MAIVVDRSLMHKPPQKHWISYLQQRIRQNKNFLGFISGQTGSGKSYTSMRIAEELDPEFGIDRCVFGGLELMNLINSGVLRKGSAIIFEEVGIELSAKNWASVTNKMLNFLLQSFRHKNFILIMNSPFMDFVDASTRKLFHAEMRTISINFEKKQVKLMPRLIQYNSRYKKFYFKRLKVVKAVGRVPIDFWNVDMPSKELRVLYEKKKDAYTDQLNKEIQEELQEFQDKKKKRLGKRLTELQEYVILKLKEGKTIPDIAEERNVDVRAVQKLVEYAKKKGYKINPIYTGKTNRKILRYEVHEPPNSENHVKSGTKERDNLKL